MSFQLLADSAAQVVQDWRVIGIITLGGIISLFIKQRGDGKKLTEVKDQVTNGGSNLAATVGEIKVELGELGADVHGLRRDIGGLRGELRDERHDRIKGDQERAAEHKSERREDRERRGG